MKVTVLGCGRWGTFHSWYSSKIGHDVILWGRSGSERLESLKKTRANQYLTLPENIILTDSLEHAIVSSTFLIISINAQGLRTLCKQIAAIMHSVKGEKTFILCMKGLESETGKRLSEVFREELGEALKMGVWLGPGHVQEFVKGVPNCMVIDSDDSNTAQYIVQKFGSSLIRFYYGEDLIGNEIGAAAKNVMGIAAGILDGLGICSLKGALMARGAREISRLIKAMGGNVLTAYGLCHLGDYEATLFSYHSHNRRFGESLVKGESFDKLAEGVKTAEALQRLSGKYNVDIPICSAIYSIIREKLDPREVLRCLFLRPTKFEFYK